MNVNYIPIPPQNISSFELNDTLQLDSVIKGIISYLTKGGIIRLISNKDLDDDSKVYCVIESGYGARTNGAEGEYKSIQLITKKDAQITITDIAEIHHDSLHPTILLDKTYAGYADFTRLVEAARKETVPTLTSHDNSDGYYFLTHPAELHTFLSQVTDYVKAKNSSCTANSYNSAYITFSPETDIASGNMDGKWDIAMMNGTAGPTKIAELVTHGSHTRVGLNTQYIDYPELKKITLNAQKTPATNTYDPKTILSFAQHVNFSLTELPSPEERRLKDEADQELNALRIIRRKQSFCDQEGSRHTPLSSGLTR